jgi:hypothetical protein
MQLTLIWTSTVTLFLAHRSSPWFWNVHRPAAPVTWSARILPPHFFPFWGLASLEQMDSLLFCTHTPTYPYDFIPESSSVLPLFLEYSSTHIPPALQVESYCRLWSTLLTQWLVKVLLSIIYLASCSGELMHMLAIGNKAGRQRYWGQWGCGQPVILLSPLWSFGEVSVVSGALLPSLISVGQSTTHLPARLNVHWGSRTCLLLNFSSTGTHILQRYILSKYRKETILA